MAGQLAIQEQYTTDVSGLQLDVLREQEDLAPMYPEHMHVDASVQSDTETHLSLDEHQNLLGGSVLLRDLCIRAESCLDVEQLDACTSRTQVEHYCYDISVIVFQRCQIQAIDRSEEHTSELQSQSNLV